MTKPPYKPPHAATLSPYLCVKGAMKAIQFYKDAFGAELLFKMDRGDRVGHAELKINDAQFMIADEFPEVGFHAPKPGESVPVNFVVYVPDCDATIKKMLDGGGKQLRPTTNQPYGDRTGQVADPFGHVWHVSTHIEDVAPDEIKRRMATAAKV